ncbi:MAG: hypothetical protein LBC87_09635 [Fibromonadaceae bacterium]|jgi:hypothetical protein|nr:hypothetical protein [Fibromonadaceae bacterium]
MKQSFNTENKNFIRENWNKPIIKFLSKRIGEKLIYIGLPSPEAGDVKQWLEHIKSIIAFQCRDYGKASNPNQNRDQIIKLDNFLRELERQEKIEDYTIYDGYLEEVVLKEYDNSPNEIKFSQDKFITLYNLDFCNDIASPIEYTDKNGNIKKAYKFNAIQKLLGVQKLLSEISNKFIFYLTVHCSYKDKELQDFINTTEKSIKDYLKRYSSLKGDDKNAEIVRLFVCHNIKKYFSANDFSYHILPIIKYQGIGKTTLLHFSVIGIHPEPTAEGAADFQPLDEIIKRPFITIENEQFKYETILEEENIDPTERIDPIKLFEKSQTFKKMWNIKKSNK